MSTRRVDIGDLELAVVERGEGGRPLLVVHGFTGAKEDFADWLDHLAAAGWHVVAPDLRGHGESDKPDDEASYDLDLFVGDTLALLDALGWERAVVLGHSMGGMFVQLVAAEAPERVEALILMDTHHGSVPDLDPDLLASGIEVALTQGMDPVADIVAAMGEDDPLVTPAYQRLIEERPERKEQSDRNLRVVAPAMYAAMLRQLPDQEDRLARLVELGMPTLVLVGEQDRPFLEASRRMAEAIPNARLVVIPEAGHSPQLEAPDAWWAALGAFLDEIAAGA